MTGADAEDRQAEIEEPVEEALQLRLVGERSAQLGEPGVTAKRKPIECPSKRSLSSPLRTIRHGKPAMEPIILGARRLRIRRHDVHPGERVRRARGAG